MGGTLSERRASRTRVSKKKSREGNWQYNSREKKSRTFYLAIKRWRSLTFTSKKVSYDALTRYSQLEAFGIPWRPGNSPNRLWNSLKATFYLAAKRGRSHRATSKKIASLKFNPNGPGICTAVHPQNSSRKPHRNTFECAQDQTPMPCNATVKFATSDGTPYQESTNFSLAAKRWRSHTATSKKGRRTFYLGSQGRDVAQTATSKKVRYSWRTLLVRRLFNS